MIKCDGERPIPDGGTPCDRPALFECMCNRCQREPDPESRFHCCDQHQSATSAFHERVYDRPASWAYRVLHPDPAPQVEQPAEWDDNLFYPDGAL